MRIEAISRPRSAPTRSICRFCDPIMARVSRRPCRCRGRRGSRGHHRCDRCRPDRVPSVIVPSVVMPLAAAGLADRRPSWHPCRASHSCPVPSRQRRDRPEGCRLPSAVGRAGTATAPPFFLPGGFGRSFLPPSLGFFASFDCVLPSSPPARQPLLSSRRASGARRWLPAPRSAHWQASQGPAAPMYYPVYPSLRAWKAARPTGVGVGGEAATGGVVGAGIFATVVASRSSSEETGSD